MTKPKQDLRKESQEAIHALRELSRLVSLDALGHPGDDDDARWEFSPEGLAIEVWYERPPRNTVYWRPRNAGAAIDAGLPSTGYQDRLAAAGGYSRRDTLRFPDGTVLKVVVSWAERLFAIRWEGTPAGQGGRTLRIRLFNSDGREVDAGATTLRIGKWPNTRRRPRFEPMTAWVLEATLE